MLAQVRPPAEGADRAADLHLPVDPPGFLPSLAGSAASLPPRGRAGADVDAVPLVVKRGMLVDVFEVGQGKDRMDPAPHLAPPEGLVHPSHGLLRRTGCFCPTRRSTSRTDAVQE